MWKNFTFALITLTLLSACGSGKSDSPASAPVPAQPKTQRIDLAKFPNEAGTPFGRWATAPQAVEADRFQYKFYVNRAEETAMQLDCIMDGKNMTGYEMLRTRIEGNTLKLLEATTITARGENGASGCQAEFEAGSFRWEHNGDFLSLTNVQTGERTNFTRF